MSQAKMSSFGVAIHVKELDKMVDFYTRLLGMTEVARPQEEEVILQWGGSSGPSMFLLGPGLAVPQAHERRTGVNHVFAFVADVRDLHKRLVEDGVQVSEPNEVVGGVTIAMATDPDGNTVELIEA